MKIATWNINGIKARIEGLKQWLKQAEPDLVCLQEIKSIDDNFPRSEIEDLGYNVETHGQKSFNGVALLSKLPLEDVQRGLPGNESDEQARFIEASVSVPCGSIRVAGIYLPNGNPVDSDKFSYKLDWMEHLLAHAKQRLLDEEPFIIAGDYNVIPTPEDVHDPIAWEGDALFRQESKDAFRKLLALGFTDAFRACTAEPNLYTFWDYQAGAWQKNHGIRIDHLLLSPQAADRLKSCEIDKFTRAWEKPSDHVPVWIDLDTAEE